MCSILSRPRLLSVWKIEALHTEDMHEGGTLTSQLKATHGDNVSRITTVILMGFPNAESSRLSLFTLLVLIYCGTICGNLVIDILVSISKNLHSPMYFFLTQVSISDIILISTIVPNTLHFLLLEARRMPFLGCIAQYVTFSFALSSECLLLTVMSYDRYLAICNPLRYTSIMGFRRCLALAAMAWFLSLSVICVKIINVSHLHFCGPNVVHHFFCDLYPLLQLSCSDTSIFQIQITVIVVTLVITPLVLIIASYTCIISSILKIQSLSRRRKVFSTCSSHLTVVCIFYGTLCGIYILPNKGQAFGMSTAFSLFYTVVTPLLNPIVYSLRNKELKIALKASTKRLSLCTGTDR